MKLVGKIALSLAILAVAGLVVCVATKRSDTNDMLDQIADEGYETATDVLFPGKKLTGRKLRYGPTIPGRP
jgi:hypothetical protein